MTFCKLHFTNVHFADSRSFKGFECSNLQTRNFDEFFCSITAILCAVYCGHHRIDIARHYRKHLYNIVPQRLIYGIGGYRTKNHDGEL